MSGVCEIDALCLLVVQLTFPWPNRITDLLFFPSHSLDILYTSVVLVLMWTNMKHNHNEFWNEFDCSWTSAECFSKKIAHWKHFMQPLVWLTIRKWKYHQTGGPKPFHIFYIKKNFHFFFFYGKFIFVLSATTMYIACCSQCWHKI